jgi:hypothetical protein
MRDVLILAVHLLVTCAKLLRPGGMRAVAAESLLLKHQLVISNRSRQRAPNLTTLDRFVPGLTTLFVNPRRIAKLGVLVKPATLFKFHRALTDRNYRLLSSSSSRRRNISSGWTRSPIITTTIACTVALCRGPLGRLICSAGAGQGWCRTGRDQRRPVAAKPTHDRQQGESPDRQGAAPRARQLEMIAFFDASALIYLVE